MTINQQNPDQGWQQVQEHIESFFNQTRTSNVQRIEYKPLFTALLEMPSERNLNKLRETGA